MKTQPQIRSTRKRRGFTLLETMVSATLVVAMLSIATPMVIRTARIWKQTQHVQMAMDELTVQLDALVVLPAEDREDAIGQLAVSPDVSNVLRSATLTGNRVIDDDGERIELEINWQRLGDPPPLRLTAWVGPVLENIEDQEPTE